MTQNELWESRFFDQLSCIYLQQSASNHYFKVYNKLTDLRLNLAYSIMINFVFGKLVSSNCHVFDLLHSDDMAIT